MVVGRRKAASLRHLEEELAEFADAETIADQADALIDLVYVALGRVYEMGLVPGPLFEAVHAANMRKVPGANKRGTEYEAAKPEGWTGPALQPYLQLTRADLAWLIARKRIGGAVTPGQMHDRAVVVESISGNDELAAVSATSALTFPDRPCVDDKPRVFSALVSDTCEGPIATVDEAIEGRMAAARTDVASTFCGRPVDEVVGIIDAHDRVSAEAQTVARKRGKPQLTFIPTEFMVPTARQFEFGAAKYSKHGYKLADYKFSDPLNALLRHVFEFLDGKDYDLDPETALPDEWRPGANYSGNPLIGALGCNVAMLGWLFENKYREADDRHYSGRYGPEFRKGSANVAMLTKEIR